MAEDVEDIRHQHTYQGVLLDENLEKVFEAIHNGTFGNSGEFRALTDTVTNHDHWLTSADFASYVKTQENIDEVFKDQEEWLRKTIVSVSRMGFFSSDRCIEEYAEGIPTRLSNFLLVCLLTRSSSYLECRTSEATQGGWCLMGLLRTWQRSLETEVHIYITSIESSRLETTRPVPSISDSVAMQKRLVRAVADVGAFQLPT